MNRYSKNLSDHLSSESIEAIRKAIDLAIEPDAVIKSSNEAGEMPYLNALNELVESVPERESDYLVAMSSTDRDDPFDSDLSARMAIILAETFGFYKHLGLKKPELSWKGKYTSERVGMCNTMSLLRNHFDRKWSSEVRDIKTVEHSKSSQVESVCDPSSAPIFFGIDEVLSRAMVQSAGHLTVANLDRLGLEYGELEHFCKFLVTIMSGTNMNPFASTEGYSLLSPPQVGWLRQLCLSVSLAFNAGSTFSLNQKPPIRDTNWTESKETIDAFGTMVYRALGPGVILLMAWTHPTLAFALSIIGQQSIANIEDIDDAMKARAECNGRVNFFNEKADVLDRIYTDWLMMSSDIIFNHHIMLEGKYNKIQSETTTQEGSK